MPSNSSNALLVCDMDETVIRVNSFPRFVRFLARHLVRTHDYVGLGRLAMASSMRRLGLLSHRDLKEAVHRLACEVDQETLELWAQVSVTAWARDDVVAYVARWPGRRLLATAAPEIYASHIGRILGFEVVQGSTWVDGKYSDNRGETKVQRLRDSGVKQIDVVVTDDPVLDGPLVAMAETAFMVSADALFSGVAL